ncbi:MAG: YncE family protein [Deltaproteobacteria bacterium]|nr:YncE family protein [Deltaproteobacteria bacterium]
MVAKDLAYVLSNPISVIDTATSTVSNPIPIFSANMQFIAVSPDGTTAYVGNYAGAVAGIDSGSVTVINTITNTVVTSIPVPGNGFGIAVTPNGSKAYVANWNTPPTVSVIDTATKALIRTIPVTNGPFEVAITPDGTRAYVSASPVAVIDTATDSVVATVAVGDTPRGLAISPDGARAYVANYSTTTVSIIDTASNLVIGTIPLDGADYPNQGMVITPDGSRLFVTSGNDVVAPGRGISVVDTASNALLTRIDDTSQPRAIAITSDGKRAYATHYDSDKVLVIDTATNLVIDSFSVASGSLDIAIAVVAPTPSATPTPPAGCAQTPVAGCQSPGKSWFNVRNRINDAVDSLRWKWRGGPTSTSASQFGDPVSGSTGYRLCVYDESGTGTTLALGAAVPSGGMCVGGRACWRVRRNGFTYLDSAATPDGLRRVVLKATGRTRAQIVVGGKGINLPMPTPGASTLFAQNPKVTVQLQKTDGPECWEAAFFAPAQRNAPTLFKDAEMP